MKLVTKNFRIKTQEGFTDVINFLSESVFFRDGRNLDTRLKDEVDTLNNRIDTEVDTLEQADAAEKKAREDEIVRVEGLITAEQEARITADNTLTTNLNKEIQDRIDAINNEKTARESAVNNINTKIGSVQYNGDSLTDGIKKAQDKGDDNFTIIAQNTNNISKNASDITQINEEITTIKKELNSTLNVLTEEQKDAIQALMEKWKNNDNRNKFYHSGNIIMDTYASDGVLDGYNSNKGKYQLNCSTFVQFIMMGAEPEEIASSNFDGSFTPFYNFGGYNFKYKEREKVFGILRDKNADNPKERYYGFRNPLNDTENWKGTFSKNTYYTPSNANITVGSQAFNPFAYANDMAKELYELGCEIPYSALDIGDIVFSTSLDTDTNESMFDNVAWRKITHVFMVYGFANNEPIFIECTDQGDDNPPIATSCLGWTDEGLDSSRMQASALTRKIVMCARMPIAFGFSSNLNLDENGKAIINLTKIPSGVER